MLGMATEHDLYKIIKDIDVCTEFEMLQVKVPISFLGTVGFSLRREGRYRVLRDRRWMSRRNCTEAAQ